MTPRQPLMARALAAALLVLVLAAAGGAGAQFDPTIVGGQEATPGEWPWQVALVTGDATDLFIDQFCGGSLIDRQWVLTAAHCVASLGAGDLDVVAGIHNLSSPAPDFGRSDVSDIIIHPDYNDGAAFNNDIALLKLETPIADRPAADATLPIARVDFVPGDAGALVGRNATVTGWGALSQGGASSETLQEVVVPIISNTDCQTDYNAYGDTITGNMLCAGFDAGGKDSCQGDSGGPLVIYDSGDARWEQAGVVSWGNGCAKPNTPGVYTRLSNYEDWINDHIQSRIAFVIDDTGSMGDEIADVKATVTEKVDEFTERSLAFEYHLLTYKDSVDYVGRTTNPAVIKDWVNGLEAEGGGDCPEEMLDALDRLAEEAPESEAWVLTDAGFHRPWELPVTIFNLVRAGVTVHPIVYSWCFARGATDDGQTTGAGLPSSVAADGTDFARLAAETGGHYFLIDSSETRAATDILLVEMTAPSDVALFHATVDGTRDFGLDVDPTAGTFNVMLNVFSGGAELVLRTPGGATVNDDTPGVDVTTLSNVRYYQVSDPADGRWTATVNGDADFALSASGETAVDFEYLGDTTLTNGVAVTLLARLTGPVGGPVFELVRPDGSVLTAVNLRDDGGHGDGAPGDGLYGGSYTPATPGSYFLRARGTAAGGAFQRTAPEAIRVHALRVEAPPGKGGKPGDLVSYTFTVRNNGPTADTVDLAATSSHGWATTAPASVALAANGSQAVNVTVRIPGNAAGGTVDELALAAVSRANPLASDVAVAITTVGAPVAPIYLPTVLRIPFVPPERPLVNGDFELGHAGWTEFSAQGWPIIYHTGQVDGLPVHGGVWSAWLGGDHNEDAFIAQEVTVPADRPFLSYWHGIGSQDSCGSDRAQVLVNGTVAAAYDLCQATVTATWQRRVVNLAAYAGQTVELKFRVVTNGSLISNLFIDDVAFVSSGRAASATAAGETAAGNGAPLTPVKR